MSTHIKDEQENKQLAISLSLFVFIHIRPLTSHSIVLKTVTGSTVGFAGVKRVEENTSNKAQALRQRS